ncbi:hypothetical protein SCUP234_11932 [Seiridium cupressi]
MSTRTFYSEHIRLQHAQKQWALESQRSEATRSFARVGRLNLQPGDIVFLKPVEEFDILENNCLVKTGYLPERAAGHPVIILEHKSGSTHAIVTTISAYSSGEWNDNLAPWKQECHSSKMSWDFRAFEGSERPDKRRSALQLEGGKLMPKPQVSWVYTKCAFVVPITALKNYNKSRTRLRMTQQSLDDLRGQMYRTPHIKDLTNDPQLSYAFVDGAVKAPGTATGTGPPWGCRRECHDRQAGGRWQASPRRPAQLAPWQQASWRSTQVAR